MIAVVITLKSVTVLPPVYVIRRIRGSAPLFQTEQQLQAYLEDHQYRRLRKAALYPVDRWIGLWVAEGCAADGDDQEVVAALMQRIENS